MTAWGSAWGPAWGSSWGLFTRRVWSFPPHHTAFDILDRNVVTVRSRSGSSTYVFWTYGTGILSADRPMTGRSVSLSGWTPGFVLIP